MEIKTDTSQIVANNGEKPTKTDTSLTISKSLGYEIQTKEKVQQDRTIMKKKLFLEYYGKSMGVISITCEKIDLDRSMFYDWMKDDADFARAVKNVDLKKNQIAEDILWGMITHEHDGPSIRFYLQAKHSEFKSKLKVEGGMTVTPTKSLTEMLREEAVENLNKTNDTIHGTTNSGGDGGQPNIDREIDPITKQARGVSADEVQPGTGIILAEKNAQESDHQSETKGVI
jgi:hypothetical protein